jgi:hypothetical protein
VSGDSAVEDRRGKLDEFLAELDEVIAGRRMNVHFELDDPSGNSYLQVSIEHLHVTSPPSWRYILTTTITPKITTQCPFFAPGLTVVDIKFAVKQISQF